MADSIDVRFTKNDVAEILHGDRGTALIVEKVMNTILESEMTHHLGAEPNEHTGARKGYRNGSYSRKLISRVGTLELEVPRDRAGTFKTELFERYQRSEKALVLAMMQMVIQGVSTRKVKKITRELCGHEFTKSVVSALCEKLDEQVRAWAGRPLDGSYPFLVVDAMQVKVRRQGAVRSTTAMIVIGISEEGYREILGINVSLGETGPSWEDLFSQLKARGLTGVDVVTSDAHQGLQEAIFRSFPGVRWIRCHAHFRRNVMDKTPKRYRDRMHEILDGILSAPTPEKAREEFEAATDELEGQANRALETLEAGFEDVTSVLTLPGKYRRRLRTTNMVERFIEEIRRREKVIRIFPTMTSAWRMVGALCAEQHEEWSTGRRYLNMDEYFRWKSTPKTPDEKLPQAA